MKKILLLTACIISIVVNGQTPVTNPVISQNPSMGSDGASVWCGSTSTPDQILRLNSRFGHLLQGLYGDGWSTWSTIGRPNLGMAPRRSDYYGYSVNHSSDKVFFGLRGVGTTTAHGTGDTANAVIAWGDDDIRLIFEWHDNAGYEFPCSNGLREIATMTRHGRMGIGTSGAALPAARLHVNLYSNLVGNNLANGIRFQGLPIANYDTVVVIDSSGNLAKRHFQSGSTAGNFCGSASNPLTSNYVVPLGTNKYFFSGQSLLSTSIQQDVVSVGYNCNSALPVAKFSVLEDQTNTTNDETFAGYFENNDNASVSLFDITGGVRGRSFRSKGTNDATNVGGVFEAHDSRRSIGVIGRLGVSDLYTRFDIGVGGMFLADTIAGTGSTAGSMNFGVYAKADKGSSNYGVYAEVSTSNPAIAPGGAIPTGGDFAGYFVGDVVRTGNDNFLSDKRFKENIDNIPDALSIINKIETKTYTYKNSEYAHMSLPRGKQFGVIAQQVMEVLPEVINPAVHPEKFDNKGNKVSDAINYLTVEYQQFIPLLINSVQQLHQKNKNLDSLVDILTKKLDAQNNHESPNALQENLNDKNAFVLDQNIPNPFSQETVINYTLPQQIKTASLIVYDLSGKQLTSFPLELKAKSITITSDKLSAGIYIYSVMADGKIMDSKRMVVADKQ